MARRGLELRLTWLRHLARQPNALELAINASAGLRNSDVTLFAWGFGSVAESTLMAVATPPAATHAFFTSDFSTMRNLVSRVRLEVPRS